MKKIVALLVISILFFNANAQRDVEFWLAAPEVSHTSAYTLDRPILLRITTYSQSASVNIYQPAAGATMLPQSLFVPANSTGTFNLTQWINVLESKPANSILDYGLKIESTAPVSVYYEVEADPVSSTRYNPELFVLKGRNALGTNFIIPSQNLVNNNSSGFDPPNYSSFDIVATEDNTFVSITPSNDIVGHPATSGMFSISLNKGQVYSATATGQAATDHLQGSTVTASKPIAITIKDDGMHGVYGTCSDLGGDQIIPISLLGTEYIAMNGQLNSPGDYVFLTAIQNNTQISKNGTLVTTINQGATYQMQVGGSSTYIETSNPVSALQLSGIGCEMSLSQLPSINCTGSDTVAFARASNEQLWINVIVPAGNQANFEVNGNPGVLTGFATVPGTGGQWVAARVSLPVSTYPKGSIIRVTNSTAKFHLGALDGSAVTGASFGYFSDYGSINASASATSPVCIGGSIQLQANTIPGATYSWVGPNGFTSTAQNPIISGATFANTGTYLVTVTSGSCQSYATVNVSVIRCPKECIVEAGYCINFNYPLTFNFWATGNPSGGTYTWDFGDGSPAITTGVGNISHTYPSGGWFSFSVTYTTSDDKECVKKYDLCLPDFASEQKESSEENSIQDSDEQGFAIDNLYPNPAYTEINIPIGKAKNKVNIVIISVDGKELFSQKATVPENGLLRVPINHLTEGVYFLEIKVNGKKKVKKFVKL